MFQNIISSIYYNLYLVYPNDILSLVNLCLSMLIFNLSIASISKLFRYQFNPQLHQTNVVVQILLKALMNLPRTDFHLCKCLIDENHAVSFDNKFMLIYKVNCKIKSIVQSLLAMCVLPSFVQCVCFLN